MSNTEEGQGTATKTIRTLAGKWEECYEALLAQHSLTPEQTRNFEVMFYAGATALMEIQMELLSAPTDIRMTVAHNVTKELKQFCAEMAKDTVS